MSLAQIWPSQDCSICKNWDTFMFAWWRNKKPSWETHERYGFNKCWIETRLIVSWRVAFVVSSSHSISSPFSEKCIVLGFTCSVRIENRTIFLIELVTGTSAPITSWLIFCLSAKKKKGWELRLSDETERDSWTWDEFHIAFNVIFFVFCFCFSARLWDGRTIWELREKWHDLKRHPGCCGVWAPLHSPWWTPAPEGKGQPTRCHTEGKVCGVCISPLEQKFFSTSQVRG